MEFIIKLEREIQDMIVKRDKEKYGTYMYDYIDGRISGLRMALKLYKESRRR